MKGFPKPNRTFTALACSYNKGKLVSAREVVVRDYTGKKP
jgi:hypothetical protein